MFRIIYLCLLMLLLCGCFAGHADTAILAESNSPGTSASVPFDELPTETPKMQIPSLSCNTNRLISFFEALTVHPRTTLSPEEDVAANLIISLLESDCVVREECIPIIENIKDGIITQEVTDIESADYLLRNLIVPINEGAEKIVIICAHYDSLGGIGALDNATGVAALMELAQNLSTYDKESIYELRLIFFSGEESLLKGSWWYNELLPDEEHDKIAAVINLDCIGFNGTAQATVKIVNSDSQD